MPSQVWTLGSYDFIAQGVPRRSLSVSPGWRLNPVTVPLAQGVIVPGSPRRNGTPLNITGVIHASTAVLFRTAVDTLVQALNAGSSQLKIWDDRYMDVVASGFRIEHLDGYGMTAAEFIIDLFAPDGVQVSTTLDTSSSTTNATPTVTNGGNVVVYPLITVTAPGGGLTAFTAANSTTGETFSWSGSILVGDELVIDMDGMTMTEAGVSDYSGYESPSRWWGLDVGANSLNLTSTPTGATVTVEKRDMWG